MPRYKQFNPIHKIEIIRDIGDPSDFQDDFDDDNTNTRASQIETIATVFSQRIDTSGHEVGSEGQHYFKARTKYKVKADITFTRKKKIQDLIASFGSHAFGDEPFGGTGEPEPETYGAQARTADFVWDVARKKRYRIVAITQTMDDKYLIFTCEETQ